MKKILCLIMIIFFVFTFFMACQDTKKTDDKIDSESKNIDNKLAVSKEDSSPYEDDDMMTDETDSSTPPIGRPEDVSSEGKENIENNIAPETQDDSTNVKDLTSPEIISSDGDLIAKLPSFVKSIGYVNLKSFMNIKQMKKILEEQMDKEEMSIVLESGDFNEFVFGFGDDFKMEMKDITNSVFIVGGKYDKEKIKKIKSKLEMQTEATFGKVESLKNDKTALLFISPTILAVTEIKNVETVIESVKNGKGTINKNSELYKEIKKMDNNLIRMVTNLKSLGEQDLTALQLPDIEGKTTLGLTKMGLSENNNVLSIGLSVAFDREDITKSLAESLSAMVPVLYLTFIVPSLETVNDDELKADLQKLVEEFNLDAQGKVISTKINVKISTLEKLAKASEEIMDSNVTGGF